MLFILFLYFPLLVFSWGNPRGRRKVHFWCEDFYNHYCLNLQYTYEHPTRNIFYLEWALASPFRPYEKALIKIKDNKEWTRYKKLLVMHIHFLLTESYIHKANQHFQKYQTWYEAKELKDAKKQLSYAKYDYKLALHYWKKTLQMAKDLDKDKKVLHLMGHTESVKRRIADGRVFYEKHINRYITRVDDEVGKIDNRLKDLADIERQLPKEMRFE